MGGMKMKHSSGKLREMFQYFNISCCSTLLLWSFSPLLTKSDVPERMFEGVRSFTPVLSWIPSCIGLVCGVCVAEVG